MAFESFRNSKKPSTLFYDMGFWLDSLYKDMQLSCVLENKSQIIKHSLSYVLILITCLAKLMASC